MMRNIMAIALALALVAVVVAYAMGPGPASKGQVAGSADSEGKVYITDRTGERWDITQAVGLGFEARKFQYGIGRWAFTTLDSSHMSDDASGASGRMRVIGVDGEAEDHAYSVRKLARHEVANTKIDGKPIAVGY